MCSGRVTPSAKPPPRLKLHVSGATRGNNVGTENRAGFSQLLPDPEHMLQNEPAGHEDLGKPATRRSKGSKHRNFRDQVFVDVLESVHAIQLHPIRLLSVKHLDFPYDGNQQRIISTRHCVSSIRRPLTVPSEQVRRPAAGGSRAGST